ncbi:hypothetical protein FQA39_LY04356 [Lamprigera yunnana]|nr:hypothetical protein FQA39_LY04356 [Lamprigera yunnana]
MKTTGNDPLLRAKNLLVMDDTSVVQNGAQVGLQGGPATNVKQNEENNTKAQYSISGILHFIQHEWARFELERSQWEVDRAELQARIAFLQGERKGQENLKSDLVRRIKMLEYALKQERAKFHKLKYGVELQQGDMKPPQLDEGNGKAPMDIEESYTFVSKATWKQGYTDRIIDVQSNRVRTLLGLNNNADQEEATTEQVNGNESNKRASETQGRRTPAKKTQPSCLTEAMMFDTEAAVMANLDFLLTPDVDMEDDDNMSDYVELEATDELEDDVKAIKRRGDDVDVEAMEVLNDLNLLSKSENQHQEMKDTGELAQLTVNNDAETSYDISSSKEAFRKTWSAKYTLRSHFDGVRALCFHPKEPVLITGSEDHTLKLWTLQKTVPAKKSASLDVEPLYTFRSHNGPVLCLAISGSGDHCYSGGLDGKIHCWNVPNSNIDPYDLFEPDVLSTTLQGHTDAVWGLSELQSEQQLLSCASKGAVKLWSPHSKIPLLNTFTSEQDGIPSSVNFVEKFEARIELQEKEIRKVVEDHENESDLELKEKLKIILIREDHTENENFNDEGNKDNEVADPIPSTSQTNNRPVDQNMHDIQNSAPIWSGLLVSPKDIVPIPKCKTETQKNNRKRGSTAIITDSPYKNELEISKEFKKPAVVKKQVFDSKKTKRKVATKKSRTPVKDDTSSSDDDAQKDVKCLYCLSLFSK